MKTRIAFIAAAVLLGSPMVGFAEEPAPAVYRSSTDAAPSSDLRIDVARRGGYRGASRSFSRSRSVHRGGFSRSRSVHRSGFGRSRHVSRGRSVHRGGYSRSRYVSRSGWRGGRNVYRGRHVNRRGWSRNVYVHRGRGYAAYRPWVRRPYFGRVVGGVALGAVIAATAVPVAPAPGLCWYWSNTANTRGYWDYCSH